MNLEEMVKAALSRYDSHYDKAIESMKYYKKAEKIILLKERISRSLFVLLIWICMTGIIPYLGIVPPEKRNTSIIILSIITVIIELLCVRKKTCLTHCLFTQEQKVDSKTYIPSSEKFQEWVDISVDRKKYFLPETSFYEQAIFDEMGRIRKFYTIEPSQEIIELSFSDYISIDEKGQRVVKCSGVTKSKRNFLVSMYGEDGPKCSKEINAEYVTNEPLISFHKTVPSEIRKKCVAVSLFNIWDFLVWNVDNLPEFERSIDELTKKIACLTAVRVLNKMCDNETFTWYPDDKTYFYRDIQWRFLKREILASFFNRPRYTNDDIGKILEKLECEIMNPNIKISIKSNK